jgi:hypothetical protein
MKQNIPCKDALLKNHPEKSFDPKWDFDLPKKLIWDNTTRLHGKIKRLDTKNPRL